MTAAERLVALAGQAGTAGALLLLIGAGATAGAALVNYSGLASGTAAEHLLVDRVPVVAGQAGGGSWIGRPRKAQLPAIKPSQHDTDDDVLMIIL